jgi:hypothetical protein
VSGPSSRGCGTVWPTSSGGALRRPYARRTSSGAVRCSRSAAFVDKYNQRHKVTVIRIEFIKV